MDVSPFVPFLLKKTVAPLLMPLLLGLFFLAGGLVLLQGNRRRRLGWSLVAVGLIGLGLSGWRPAAEYLVHSLENRYPPLRDPTPYGQVPWIAVLAGGQLEGPDRSAVNRLTTASLARLAEGLRLQRLLPHSRLLLSGGIVFSGPPEARVLAEAALELGADPRRLVLEERSRDTEEQAREIRRLVGPSPVILVTSALHLPRSMDLFEQQGLRPVPAPCGYLSGMGNRSSPEYWIPRGRNLFLTEGALHEYLGMIWFRVRRAAAG